MPVAQKAQPLPTATAFLTFRDALWLYFRTGNVNNGLPGLGGAVLGRLRICCCKSLRRAADLALVPAANTL